MILFVVMKLGFLGGLVVDYFYSIWVKKYFFVFSCGLFSMVIVFFRVKEGNEMSEDEESGSECDEDGGIIVNVFER